MKRVRVRDDRRAEVITDYTTKRPIGEDERLLFEEYEDGVMRPKPIPPPANLEDGPWAQYQQDLKSWYEELEAHPHVQEAMKIPSDEPIFIMRSQDIEAPEAVNYWLGLTQATIDTSKFLSAATRYQEMLEWQNVQPTRAKIPD